MKCLLFAACILINYACKKNPDGPKYEKAPSIPSFVFLEGGTYQMGAGNPKVSPVHTVTLDSFYISSTEVTFEQYDYYCDQNNFAKLEDNGWGRDKRPVMNITWQEAKNYCVWLGTKLGKTVRLPSEAEWEYAAKAKGEVIQWAGTNNQNDFANYAWDDNNSGGTTHDAASKNPNSIGLFDMCGNVWEWCNDWYSSSYYSTSPQNNPQGPVSGSNRVIRGGSYQDYSENSSTVYRFSYYPLNTNSGIGFRCVKDAK